MHKITDGITLRCWRVAHGVPQSVMAKQLGINTHTLSDIENGKVIADASYLAEAEQLLNAMPPKGYTRKEVTL